jgi:lactoylglutathione lyase
MTAPGASVTGLFEAHLNVLSLDRSVPFYRDVVGLEVAYELPERHVAFLWCGEPGGSMLGLWEQGSMPMGMRLHVAFSTTLDEILTAPARLSAHGVQPLSFFAQPTEEPSVIAWMPAASLFFTDPDGHQLEYLTMLDGPSRPEVGIVPWSEYAGA